jgi:ADP-heptose:LPS heptosyltransferase
MLIAAAEQPPLVMRFGAFGDMVLLTILLRHLHERFGKPVDVISSGPWTRPLLEGQPWLGRLFVIRSRRTPYFLSRDQQRLVSWLRQRAAGPTWYCDRSLGLTLLERGGIPQQYICDTRDFDWSLEECVADRYIRIGNEAPQGLLGQLPPPRPASSRAAQLFLTERSRHAAAAWLAQRGLANRPYIVVHPGCRHIARRTIRSREGTDKYWPEGRWSAVIQSLRDYRPDAAIVLTGTRAESLFNAEIIRRSGIDDIHNVADELPVSTLLPFLERAHSMLAVDTGPAHAAAALGTDTVALYGTASPVVFRPGGATTHTAALTGDVDGVQNILGISTDAVIAAWLKLIQTSGIRPPEPQTSTRSIPPSFASRT